MKINETAQAVHENAKSKGFFDEPKNIGEMLCLIHSEVSEALECDRKDKYARTSSYEWDLIEGSPNDNDFKELFEDNIKDTFEDKLADIMIRVMDLAAFKEIDLESHISAKMRYNSLRPHKHGKKY